MRRTHYFGLIAAFAFAQGALIYGCSADAGAPIEDVDAATQPTPDATTGDDAPFVGEEDTGTTLDAGKKDTGIADAKPDVKLRADTGAPGSPCSPAGAPETQECGKCGTQSRVCLGGAADAGATWSAWGACLNEASEPSCDPYEADAGVEPCGNCGTRVRICQPDCKLAQGIVCQGEPPNACTPGDQNFTLALGCADPNQGRLATCQANCTYGTPGPCQAPPPNLNTMTIAATVGGVATKKFTMPSAKKLGRLASGACPASTISSTMTSYVYVEVKNPTTRTVNVSVWHTTISGGPSDTVMTAYTGAVAPQDNDANARKACSVIVNDECNSNVATACTGFGPAGMMVDDTPPHNVSIPPGGSITIYSAAYSASASGDFNLNTRTEN